MTKYPTGVRQLYGYLQEKYAILAKQSFQCRKIAGKVLTLLEKIAEMIQQHLLCNIDNMIKSSAESYTMV